MPFISGTTRAKLTQAAMETVMIPLPPLAEQQRIVAKLDALMAHINHMKTDVVRIPTLIGNYKKSLLAAAISGDLTREWRTTEELPDAEDVELGSVAIDFSYGSAAKSSPSGTVPVLRMGNIQDGKLDWSNLVYTSDPAEIEKYCLIPGDVLFNRTNSPELVGKTALYDTERPAVYAGYLIRVRCSDKLSPAYLTYCLNSPIGRDYCWRVKTDGVSQSNINASKLAAFSFPLPALPEQYEIIRRIDFAFAWLDKVAAQHARAAHLLPKLDQAILAKAFRGDLVFQDPTDEPASMLLERIRAARADETRTKRSRRLRDPSTPGAPREKATMTKSRHDDDVKDRPYLADFLRQMSRPATVEDLFKRAELTLVDFYKQLAWEVDAGHIRDDD